MGDLTGRKASVGSATFRGTDVGCFFSREEERQLRYGAPSRFSPSRTVIENHVRGQSRDAEAAVAAAAAAAPFSRNTEKNKQQVRDSFRAIIVLGVQVNDDVCKHG